MGLFILISNSCKKKDKEENPIETVTIGSQTWMKMNLDVDRYRNGDIIPQATDQIKWDESNNKGTGCWCYYEYDINYGIKYGKLYNGYAVLDPRGLAPSGFHIPNDGDWYILIDYLGGKLIAGKKIKSTSGWYSGNGTNESGFSGLPGGYKETYDSFLSDGFLGAWWSLYRNPSSSGLIIFQVLYSSDEIRTTTYSTWAGFSLRCIKDLGAP